jgi:hypothetical protein
VTDLPAPVEYFGLRVGLIDRAPGERERAFALTLENRTDERWFGRIPLVWVQGGIAWTEGFDVDLRPRETHRLGVATRWSSDGATLEARLPTERSPRELARLPPGKADSEAVTSRYLPLATLSAPTSPAEPGRFEDRRELLRETAVLLVASVAAVVSAILLVIYATSIL